MTVRVRYAPSPTGHLHIGGVRTALFNFLFARHHDGQFIMRFEDTDLERNVPGADGEILDSFRWLGIDWDEGPDIGGPFGPYRCTHRLEVYTGYLEKLRRVERVYPCFCTQEELAKERDRAQKQGATPRYSGKCRHLSEGERSTKLAQGFTPNWRFRVDEHEEIAFDDLIRGHVTFQSDDLGDFIIVKSNGIPTYNFQVVIDDALMKITHVIRGEEHLSNSPSQILLQRALGVPVPVFAHLPQVLNTDRKKLSKRDPNVKPVLEYRELGYVPEAIVNFLALLGWSPGSEEESFDMNHLIRLFDLDRVNRSGAVFDVDKLRWMAGRYLRKQPLPDLVAAVIEQLAAHNVTIPRDSGADWLTTVVALFQEQMVCAADFIPLARGFFYPEIEWSGEALAVLREEGSREVVSSYRKLVAVAVEWTPEASRERFKQVQKELGVKGRALFMPVRSAVTGEVHGPDLQQTIANLPKEWVLNRMEQALAASGTI